MFNGLIREIGVVRSFDGKNLRYYLDKQLISTSDNILDDNKYLSNNEIVIGNNNNLRLIKMDL